MNNLLRKRLVLPLVVCLAPVLSRQPAAAETQNIVFQPSVPAVDVEELRTLAGDDSPEVLEALFLSRILKIAPPAPMAHREPLLQKASPTDLAIVAYDLLEDRESTYSEAMPFSSGEAKPKGSSPPYAGEAPLALDGSLTSHAEEGPDETMLESTESITPTPPGPLSNTTSFPWRTVVKMVMRFNVSGTNYFYVCSGATIGPFMVWTAGHCIFNQDPNDDGSTRDATWASEVWVWPAQTERVYINGLGVDNAEDWPYGESKATLLRSYNGWTVSQDVTWDFGWITLNQRIGDRVGWMGWEWGSETASLNFDGYPTEQPYVPAGEMRQYPGYDANNVVSYSSRRISMDAFTYGGHSGGPVWRYDGTNRYIQGVNSTSNRTGSATSQRVTSDVNSKTTTFKADDEANRPPVARPELIEYVISTTAKDLLTNTVVRGDTIQVEYNVLNVGFANTTATIDFYLSTNNFISTFDSHIGSRVFALNANTYTNPTTTLTVPSSVAAGTYYVGWIMGSSLTEYKSGDWAVIGPETLTVNDPPPDLHIPTLGIGQSSLCTNQSFGINATVENQGGSASAATTLRYLRSTNSTISTFDTLIATDAVGSLPAGGSSSENATVGAPSSPGTWWIGACVDAVGGEAVTSNQCYSPGHQISVIWGALSVSGLTYPLTSTWVRAGHLIETGPGVVIPDGADVTHEADMLAYGSGFVVEGGTASFTAINTSPPIGCP